MRRRPRCDGAPDATAPQMRRPPKSDMHGSSRRGRRMGPSRPIETRQLTAVTHSTSSARRVVVTPRPNVRVFERLRSTHSKACNLIFWSPTRQRSRFAKGRSISVLALDFSRCCFFGFASRRSVASGARQHGHGAVRGAVRGALGVGEYMRSHDRAPGLLAVRALLGPHRIRPTGACCAGLLPALGY